MTARLVGTTRPAKVELVSGREGPTGLSCILPGHHPQARAAVRCREFPA